MKKQANLFPVLFLIIAVAFISPVHLLIGQWGIPGSREYIDFKKNGTYEVYLENGTVGERGFYKLADSIFSLKNLKPVCGEGYWGTYQLNFFGNDSVHFKLIEDTCTNRRMDIVGYNPGLRRLKVK